MHGSAISYVNVPANQDVDFGMLFSKCLCTGELALRNLEQDSFKRALRADVQSARVLSSVAVSLL